MTKNFTFFIPYFILFLLMFSLINLDYTVFKDDILFYNLRQELSLYDFLVWRYFTWSSRLIIEAFLFFVVSFSPFIRIFIISLFYVLCAFSLKYLLKPKNLFQNILICVVFASFPFGLIKNTGWLATSTNYLFPLIFGLISFKSLYETRPTRICSFFILLATFIASSMEQLCAIMVIVFGVFGLYYLLRYKRIIWFYAIQLELCLFNAVLFILCPGNASRFGREMRNRLPDFAQWGYWKRFYKGLSHTMDYFFDEPFCLSLVTLNIIVYSLLAYNKRQRFYCLSILTTFAITLFLIYFWHDDMHIFFIIDNRLGWYYLLFLLLFCCLFASLFLLYGNKPWFYICILFILIGLFSSSVLGLSPTLYASSFRIFFYFLFILCVLPLLALFRYYDSVPKIQQFLVLLTLSSFYSYYLVQNIQY